MKNRRKLRYVFPEPNFQMRFLLFLFGISAAQIVLTAGIMTYFIHQNYTILVSLGGLDTRTKAVLFDELWWLISMIGATFFVHVSGMLVLGTMFSHRVGGVVYAIKRTINEIIDGKTVSLLLRKDDEFQELQIAFNAMVEKLKRAESQPESDDKFRGKMR